MKKILIQPSILTFDQYADYAKENDLYFEIIDFAFPKTIDENKKEVIKAYKAKTDKNRIISMHGVFFDLCLNSPDQKIKKVSEERILENLEIADELGIKYIVIHTNCLPGLGDPIYYKNWVSETVKFWKKHIKSFNCNVLLENMWDETPEWINEVITKVGSEKIKACFDVGHCNVFSEVPMENWFKLLGDNIVYIHVNDNMGDKDTKLIPGKGNVDWKKFDKLIGKYCKDPMIVFELDNLNCTNSNNNIKDINSAIKFIKKNTSIFN